MRLLSLFLALIFITNLSAQNQEITDDNRINIITEAITNKCNEINTLECNYIHEKSISLLDDKLKMEGSVTFMLPNNLHWSCKNNDNQSFTLKNDSIRINNGNGINIMPVQEHLIFREIHKIINNSICNKSFIDHNNFRPSFYEDENNVIIILKPKKNRMKSLFGEMCFFFDKNSFLINKIEITDSNNDITTISISDIYINETIDTEIFNF